MGKKNYIFYGLLVSFFIFLLISLNNVFKLKNPIYPIFSPIYHSMNVILETKNNNPEDIIIKVNDEYTSIPQSKNVLNKSIQGKANSIDLLINKNFKNKIDGIIIFNDLKVHYFKDFSAFKKEEVELCPNGVCKIYNKYEIPKTVQYNKNSDSLNYHSLINTICVLILSIFSGSFLFFIPYVLLFIAIIYYINNKEEINLPKTNGVYFGIILFLFGILMYSNGIFDYLPWTDEYHTIEFSDFNKPISTLFSDPGNPAIFYILFRIYIFLVGVTTFTMKMFPLFFAILTLASIWLFLKIKFDTKTANIGLFLASINVPLVYYAQEVRSYIMQAFLSPILIYLLFNVLEKNRKKDYIFYGIFVAVLSNIHYFEILLIISNFIYAFIYLILKKRYKDILKFTLTNFVGGLFFLPYFLSTALNQALLNSNFNSWIPEINFLQIKKCVYYLFGGFISLILSLIFTLVAFKNNLNDNKRNKIIIYSFFVILLTILLGILLSYTIRPMLVERYLILLSPIFIIFLALVFTSNYKKKFLILLFIVWILSIQANSFEKNNRRKGIIELPLSISKQYLETKNPNKKIHTIINISKPKYLDNKDEYMSDKITYHTKSVLSVEDAIDEILNKEKNVLIFTSTLNTNEKNANKKDNYTCYFNTATDMCLWKIENE